jgi:hypothetical protein
MEAREGVKMWERYAIKSLRSICWVCKMEDLNQNLPGALVVSKAAFCNADFVSIVDGRCAGG